MFSVYRKSTTTDTLIPGDSFILYSYKLSAFASMAHRLVSIPVCDSAYRHEISVMKYLAKLNNVHINIEKLVQKKAIKRALDGTSSLPRDATSRRDPKWVRVPYLGKTSFGLSKFLKEAGLRPAYYSPNTIQKNICKNVKDPIPLDGRSGVYVLYCSDCPSAYVGETSRAFKSRVAEYLDNPNSAFGAHLMSTGHNYAESSKLLHSESNYSRRLALEHIEIIKHKKNPNLQILNDFIPDCSLIEKNICE